MRGLARGGFVFEEGLGSLKTAFRATVASGKPGPRIAFLCEYDGLPVYSRAAATMSWRRPVSVRRSGLPR